LVASLAQCEPASDRTSIIAVSVDAIGSSDCGLFTAHVNRQSVIPCPLIWPAAARCLSPHDPVGSRCSWPVRVYLPVGRCLEMIGLSSLAAAAPSTCHTPPARPCFPCPLIRFFSCLPAPLIESRRAESRFLSGMLAYSWRCPCRSKLTASPPISLKGSGGHWLSTAYQHTRFHGWISVRGDGSCEGPKRRTVAIAARTRDGIRTWPGHCRFCPWLRLGAKSGCERPLSLALPSWASLCAAVAMGMKLPISRESDCHERCAVPLWLGYVSRPTELVGGALCFSRDPY